MAVRHQIFSFRVSWVPWSLEFVIQKQWFQIGLRRKGKENKPVCWIFLSKTSKSNVESAFSLHWEQFQRHLLCIVSTRERSFIPLNGWRNEAFCSLLLQIPIVCAQPLAPTERSRKRNIHTNKLQHRHELRFVCEFTGHSVSWVKARVAVCSVVEIGAM